MNDEFTARPRALALRRAGRPVKAVCQALGRTEAWLHSGWQRYLEVGADGLDDLTRARHVVQPIPPELERTIRSIRRRLQAHATLATRYRLIGAAAIRAELKALGIRPLPKPRPIERVRQRNGLTAPRVRLAPLLPRQEYPGPQARAANELHEVDRLGPVYLQGRGHRYYLWIGKEVVAGAVCLRLAYSRRLDEVLWFLGACWKDLGRPQQRQLDNARARAGWGPAAPTLARGIRLCLRFGVSPVFIPQGQPQGNGSVEHFNGWFPEPLFQRRFVRPGDLRRARARLQEAVNTQHVQPRRQGQTPAQHRRGLRLPKLPARFVVPTAQLPRAQGRGICIRRVRRAGTVTVRRQQLRSGKRHRGRSLRLVVASGRGGRTGSWNGRLLKRWSYRLLTA